MPGRPNSPRFPLQEVIKIYISEIVNGMQTVRGESAIHIPFRIYELNEGPKVT